MDASDLDLGYEPIRPDKDARTRYLERKMRNGLLWTAALGLSIGGYAPGGFFDTLYWLREGKSRAQIEETVQRIDYRDMVLSLETDLGAKLVQVPATAGRELAYLVFEKKQHN